jgi:hypothetical protein
VDELSEFPRLHAIAVSRKTEVAALVKESVNSLLASEGTPGDAAGLAQELDDLRNYLEQVDRFKTDPVAKPAVFNGYCVGQTLSFCEIVDGEPKLVYRFVTSSSRSPPPLNRYYAPVNIINTRNWSSDRQYTPIDARRDARMGGGDARIIPFHNGGNPIAMPNFMHFLPAPGYTGETGNGIHEIAGGLDSAERSARPSVSAVSVSINSRRNSPAGGSAPGEVLRVLQSQIVTAISAMLPPARPRISVAHIVFCTGSQFCSGHGSNHWSAFLTNPVAGVSLFPWLSLSQR